MFQIRTDLPNSKHNDYLTAAENFLTAISEGWNHECLPYKASTLSGFHENSGQMLLVDHARIEVKYHDL